MSEPYRDQNFWFELAKPKHIAVLACRNNVILLDRRLVSSGGLVYENGPYKWAVYDCSDTNTFGEWLGFKTRKAAIVYFVRLSGSKPAFAVNDKIEGTVAEAEVNRVLALTSEGWKNEPSGAEVRKGETPCKNVRESTDTEVVVLE